MRKNDAFVTEISNTRQTKISLAIIAVAERLPTSATPVQMCRQQIGGESGILEGDESQFGKCNYSRGSRKNRRRAWVFGMISRTTKRLFLYVCPQDAAGKYKRTRRALIPMILANVKPGTMLYTDGWREGMFDDYSDKS